VPQNQFQLLKEGLTMADKDIKLVNPDPPVSPGTAPVPDLDIDVEQFRDDESSPTAGEGTAGEPPD
jgi:hypothetical protein